MILSQQLRQIRQLELSSGRMVREGGFSSTLELFSCRSEIVFGPIKGALLLTEPGIDGKALGEVALESGLLVSFCFSVLFLILGVDRNEKIPLCAAGKQSMEIFYGITNRASQAP